MPPPASGGSWHFLSYGHIISIPASVFTSSSPLCVSVSFPLLLGLQSVDLGPTLNPGWFYLEIINWLHLQETYFQIRLHSEALDDMNFGGPCSTHCSLYASF